MNVGNRALAGLLVCIGIATGACGDDASATDGNGGDGDNPSSTCDEESSDEECAAIDGGPELPVGAACITHADCDTGVCLPDSDDLPGGYCSQLDCGTGTCPAGSECVYAAASDVHVCLSTCRSNDDCRADYACQFARGHYSCVPDCRLPGRGCGDVYVCDEDEGVCTFAPCDPEASDPCGADTKATCAAGYGEGDAAGICLAPCDADGACGGGATCMMASQACFPTGRFSGSPCLDGECTGIGFPLTCVRRTGADVCAPSCDIAAAGQDAADADCVAIGKRIGEPLDLCRDDGKSPAHCDKR